MRKGRERPAPFSIAHLSAVCEEPAQIHRGHRLAVDGMGADLLHFPAADGQFPLNFAQLPFREQAGTQQPFQRVEAGIFVAAQYQHRKEHGIPGEMIAAELHALDRRSGIPGGQGETDPP